VKSPQRGQHDLTSEDPQHPGGRHAYKPLLPDPTAGSAHARPPAFACSRTNGGLDATRVHVAGELDIATTPRLVRTLRETHLQAPLVVLDLRELEFIDSSGVHAIVNASIRARRLGRRLILLRGRPSVDRVFTLTGSSDELEIGDVALVEPPVQTLQRSLVSLSLLRTGATARHRGPSH
jgi:anti-sigma B factor antagonist